MAGSLTNTYYYVSDASGSPMAIYNNGTVKEHPIFGNSRLGVFYRTSATAGTALYQITDHLGNVRALLAADNTGIEGATDYYPGGMPMPARSLQDAEGYRYGYQGEFAETDEETGKPAFELRLYDPRINRWLSPDPYGQFHSPYLAMGNNWLNKIDPSGGSTEDWKPVINDDGSVSYVAEAGDTYQTFADQYGVSVEEAQALIGPGKIIAGQTTVSGQDVFTMFGNEILQLDLNSYMATTQRILDQYAFSRAHSTTEKGDSYLSTKYYSNVEFKNTMRGKGFLDIDGNKVELQYNIPVYRPATLKGSKLTSLGKRAIHSEYTTGTVFPKNQANIYLELFHPVTNVKMAEFNFYVHRKNEPALYHFLRREYPKYNYKN